MHETQKNLVAVQKGKTLQERLSGCLSHLGGISRIVAPGNKILVKPNLVMDKPHSTGAITNPELIDLLLEHLKETAPKELVIAEGSSTSASTTQAFRTSGLDKIAKKHGVKVVDLQKDRYEDILVPEGKALNQAQIARTVLETDCLINAPVLKRHCQVKFTMALKNLKGCLSDKDKKRFHSLDLEQCIADLNTVIPVQLVVADATLCSLSWEGGGEPVRLDTVLAGTNQVAVDAVAAPMLGYRPEEIKHILYAHEHGLGPIDRGTIQVVPHEAPNHMAAVANQPESQKKDHNESVFDFSRIEVIDKGACTPCFGSFITALKRLERENNYPVGTAFMGQKLTDEDLKECPEKIFGIGNCGAKIVGADRAVLGCPPDAWKIYEWFKRGAHG